MLDVEKINNIVWHDNWEGEVDHEALRERLDELLNAEIERDNLQKKLDSIEKILASSDDSYL